MGITKDAFEAQRRAQIYAAATELAAQGQTPTNDAVHALVGGGRRFITETMKAWRHEHPSPTNGAGPWGVATFVSSCLR
jgi:Plasmid replication region DNA-binding N-term